MEREGDGDSWSSDVGACKFSGSILGRQGTQTALENSNLMPEETYSCRYHGGEMAILTKDFGRRRLIRCAFTFTTIPFSSLLPSHSHFPLCKLLSALCLHWHYH